ncbi:hypothetical protein EG68_07740 [Paragonimus skrjabini miyazakii]|uniref:TBC domain-containing protein kinase-like protein n=1 Tax=Paragonimus skrjabini miyazakii TaxID=59628 RepID=A0A8S9YRZ7_9TREM|nr:hypothetical protein EG68_07740 [Paragonimus skrjabini miyazakii]
MFQLPLGVTYFEVSRTGFTELELSGLPKLPLSVICFAKLHSLRRLSHPNLCQYVDVVRRKPERLLVVTEAYRKSLANIVDPVTDVIWIRCRLIECFTALDYLSEHHLVHCCLSPSNVMLNARETVKICGFGLFYATHWGQDVDFPIYDPVYSAPETFLLSHIAGWNYIKSTCVSCPLNILSDVWSVGLIFFELIHGRHVGNPLHKLYHAANSNSAAVTGSSSVNLFATIQTLLEGLRLSKVQKHTFPDFMHVESSKDFEEPLNSIEQLCRQCLNFDPSSRPTPLTVISRLNNPERFDSGVRLRSSEENLTVESPFVDFSQSYIPVDYDFHSKSGHQMVKALEFLSNRTDVKELYYYWRLTGGNLDTVCRDALLQGTGSQSAFASFESRAHLVPTSPVGRISKPPILRLPHYLAMMRHEPSGVPYLAERWPTPHGAKSYSYHPRIVFLPCERLLERIGRIPLDILYPLFIFQPLLHSIQNVRPTSDDTDSISVRGMLCDTDQDLVENQPTSVKEADVEYQIRRICLFRRLLNGLPVTEHLLRLEAQKDIPPFLRSQIWSALLGIHRNHHFREKYAKAFYSCPSSFANVLEVDVEPSTLSDRMHGQLDEKAINQIAVDLPRCHAYDALLASPVGQASLRRVLISTLMIQPGTLEYTQALAAACLHSFFTTKLPSFFATAGFTVGLKTFFNVLLRLFAFHLPGLACYLTDINVPLVGLTTGWIYTMFAHAMPLDRTELLWDTLVAGPSALPMFFYLAVFLQLDQQVHFESVGLEKICTILSNFPDVDLDKCRSDALRFSLSTPTSLTTIDNFYTRAMARSVSSSSEDIITACPDEARESFLSGQIAHVCKGTGAPNASAPCPFYKRLCTPNAWPTHLEIPVQSFHTASSISEPSSLWLATDGLVPLLHVEDALEHLVRPDCFVLDVRRQSEYAKGCIADSVYRPPFELPISSCRAKGNDALIDSTVSCESFNADWELIDGPSGSRRTPRIVPKFLAGLLTEPAWTRATQARLDAVIKQTANRRTPLGATCMVQSPGLVMVVGGLDSGTQRPIAIQMADWLIRHEVDRVCVLQGGIPALLNLPTGRDHLVCPGLPG